MNPSIDEEETGPSVDSNDADERIAARRLRIQKRIEAQRRTAMGEGVEEKIEEKEEPRKSKKQIEDSRMRLAKLIEDGKVLVSNIRVAGDAREQTRRNEEEDVRRQRKERLEQECKAGGERFEEITKKWATALEKEIPQHLHESLMEQKASCDAMVDEKNKLINDFIGELKSKDDIYVKDLKKETEDIDLMVERKTEQISNLEKATRQEMNEIECKSAIKEREGGEKLTGAKNRMEDIDLMVERKTEQISNLEKATRQEMNEIEKAFVTERGELLDLHRKKWNERMDFRREKEEEYMKTRERHVEEQEASLQLLRTQDWEEYNQVKIHLENDVQILEQQLQQMRATYQLNQEKLEYNFQVLKKRDEENTITKSQQKRKITRMQDVLNGLKTKAIKQEKQYSDENQQLSDDYKRITEHFHELQQKSKHFIAADAKKFHDVWCMNEEECKELVKGIVNADKVIAEHQFGTSYVMPNLDFMDNVGPINPEEKFGKPVSASDVVKQVLQGTGFGGIEGLEEEDSEVGRIRSAILDQISPVTIKKIFDLLCDESGFLVEQKLKTLLAPLEDEERSLIKLDAIFSALGVETEDDVHNLSKYFIKIRAEYEEPFYNEEKADEEKAEAEEEQKEEQEEEPKEEGEEGENGELIPSDGVELVNRNLTYKVLRDFVENAKKRSQGKDKKSQFRLDVLEERDDSYDAQYWAQYAGIITSNKEQLLNAFLQALSKYSEVLNARAKLLTDTEGLRQQNVELRMLLHQYVNSKVNRELEIPPTRVLQLEMNTAHQSQNR